MRRLMLCFFVLVSPYGLLAEDPARPEEPVPYSEVIEVTASRVEQPLLDAPVAVSIIDEQQLETTPARNVADLLRGLPGVNVLQTSASDYTVRTRNATQTTEVSQLVLVDGRSVYLEYAGFVIWTLIPVNFDELEAVEVVRGPGSSVWGANAISGVINLRTRSPREIQGGLVTANVGEHGSFGAGVRWAGAAGPWSYKASASYNEQDPWPRDNVLPNGLPIPAGYEYVNQGIRQPKVDLRADRDLGDSSGTLSFRGGYSKTHGIFHSPVGPQEMVPGSFYNYVEADYTRGLFHAKANWTHVDVRSGSIFETHRNRFETRVTVLEAGSRKVIGGKHMLVFGASARNNSFDLTVSPDVHARRDGGIYVEDIFEITKFLEVNAGARVDYFTTLGTVVSPRLSIVFKPAANHAVRLAANRAYRAPTVIENHLNVTSLNGVVLDGAPFFFFTRTVGNEDLTEENVDAFEVGWSWQRGPFFISAAAYRNLIHDIVRVLPVAFFGPSDPPPDWPGHPSTVPPHALIKTVSLLNVGTVRSQGIELSVDGRFRGGWHTRASYAYQDDPRATSHVAGVPLIANGPPAHSGGLFIDRSTERWFGGASVTYTDRAYWTEIFDPRLWGYTDAYTLVNASFGYSLTPRTQFVLSGTNLLNRDVKQHIFGDIIGRKTSVEIRQRF